MQSIMYACALITLWHFARCEGGSWSRGRATAPTCNHHRPSEISCLNAKASSPSCLQIAMAQCWTRRRWRRTSRRTRCCGGGSSSRGRATTSCCRGAASAASRTGAAGPSATGALRPTRPPAWAARSPPPPARWPPGGRVSWYLRVWWSDILLGFASDAAACLGRAEPATVSSLATRRALVPKCDEFRNLLRLGFASDAAACLAPAEPATASALATRWVHAVVLKSVMNFRVWGFSRLHKPLDFFCGTITSYM